MLWGTVLYTLCGRVFISITDLHTLDASSTPLHTSVVTIKNFSRHYLMSSGGSGSGG